MATLHVLLFEDDAAIRQTLLDAFEDEGWQTTICNGLAEIQAAVRQYPSAVLVADSWRVELGRTLSPEYTAEIRSLGQSVPVLLLPSWGWAHHARPDELGAAVLPKPFDLGELIQTVRLLAASRTA